jgi:N-acetylglucosaminyldiphosphoundecaprenol N-acetyl-beta-D-mannosaminyltransferase
MIDNGKHSLLGVNMNAVDYEGAIERIVKAAKEGKPMTISALAVHGVMTGVLDKEHKYRLNDFDLLCPDGMPVRWGLNLLHKAKLPDRVYGPNLMLKVCERAAKEGLPIFLFGGTEKMITLLKEKLTEKFPAIQFAGVRYSAFRQLTPQERDDLAKEIVASGAKITFVGIGCPRQEVFAFEMKPLLPMPQLAVGAAFAFHAGLLPQAPPAWQARGLEWLYRLIQEPKRLWRRYLYLNPLYLTLLAGQRLGLYRGSSMHRPTNELRYG